jgi:hypothetical protein
VSTPVIIDVKLFRPPTFSSCRIERRMDGARKVAM